MGMGIGDWGIGQSPIPNPQSPIPIEFLIHLKLLKIKNINIIYIEKEF
jgi:hypothetical protein